MAADNSVSVSADVDLDKVRGRIGVGDKEKLRASSRRKNYLEKFARIMTSVKLRLLLHPNRSDTTYETDPPEVRISSQEWDQPVTDYPRRIYEMLMQETITLHEVGHVLYTHAENFMDMESKLDDDEWPMFRELFNVFEDGAIEAQLRGEFNVKDEILVLRANLMNLDGSFGTAVGGDKYIYTFHEATICAIMDLGCYDTGDLGRLMDEDNGKHNFAVDDDRELFEDFLPIIKDYVSKILSTEDGGKRVDLTEEFYEEYKDWIDEAEVGGQRQAKNKQEGPVVVDMPDLPTASRSGGAGGQPSQAIDLPDADDLREQLDGGAGDGESEEGDEGDEYGSAGGSLDEENPHDELGKDLVEEYSDEVRREAEDAAGSRMEEIEEYHEMLSEISDQDGGNGASDGELRDLVVDFPSNEEGNYDTFDEARRRSRQLKQALQRRLQRENRSKIKRNQRRGKFDTSNLTRASRGNPRIFERTMDEDNKEYSCMMVLDRSGSMSGRNIHAAEKAVGSLAKALEDLGIDTSLLDLCGYTPRVTLPFNSELQDNVSTVFTNNTGGGTPMAQTVALARHRLERMANKQPFMIVVTDGRPANPDQYTEELDKCNFPVIGVTTSIDGRGGSVSADGFFHRHVEVTSENQLYRQLQALCEEVMF